MCTEEQRAGGNRDSVHKGCTQNPTCSESRLRGSNLTGALVRSWRASWKSRRQLGPPSRDRDASSSHSGELVLPGDPDAASTSVASSSSLLVPWAYLPTSPGPPSATKPTSLDPNPTRQQLAASTRAPGSQRGLGASPAYQDTHSSQLCHKRRALAAHIRGTPQG